MQPKPFVTEQLIENILLGTDQQKHIRAVETLSTSNSAFIFSRSGDNVGITIDQTNPFLWATKMPFEFYNDTVKSFHINHIGETANGETTFIFNNKERVIDNETAVLLNIEETDNGVFYIIWFVLDTTIDKNCQTKSDREIILQQKQKEYGITVQKLTTSFIGSVPQERLENGYKFLYQLSETKETSSNPLFSKKKKTASKGTNSTLTDYFREGGLSMRGDVYLDVFKFYDVYKNLTTSDKYDTLKVCHINGIKLFGKQNFNIQKLYENNILLNSNDFTIEQIIDYLFSEDTRHLALNKIEAVKKGVETFINTDLTIQDLIKFKYKCQTFDNEKLNFATQKLHLLGFSDCFYSVVNPLYKMTATEQYFVQSGKRIFKGVEYDDTKKIVFDIETEGLNAKKHKTITIAAKVFWSGDKSGTLFFEDCTTDEAASILKFLDFIKSQKPDLLIGHNIFDFDIPFLLERLQKLGVTKENKKGEKTSIYFVQHYLSDMYNTDNFKLSEYGVSEDMFFHSTPSTYKAGSQTKHYTQFNIFGMSILDTLIAINRARAMNNAIPNSKLKDNVKHLKLVKKNRVYVDGNSISKIYKKTTPFLFNETNGKYKEFASLTDAKNVLKFADRSYLSELSDTKYLTVSETIGEALFHLDLNNLEQSFANLIDICWEYDEIYFPKDFLKNVPNVEEFKLKIRNFFNDVNLEKYCINNNLSIVTGEYIVMRYNIDDLDETAAVDFSYGLTTFEVGKWLPNSYQRSATIGGASNWKMFMSVVSYMFNLAVPLADEKHKFCGGLQGMCSSGYHGESVKLDFSSQYPSAYIEYCIENTTDLMLIMKPLLRYGLDKRLYYKNLKKEAESKGNYELAAFYDRQQLPLKIMLNSFFGALGAPNVFKWAEWQTAQMITASCRSVSRHAVRWFSERGLQAIYCHTDGINFDISPESLNYIYIAKGLHNSAIKDKKYSGIKGMVIEYNETFFPNMIMGLGIDEFMLGAVYFAKSNFVYAKEIDGKMKIQYVGGTLLNSVQNEYIKKYIHNAMPQVFANNPSAVIDEYNKVVADLLANKFTPRSIASKKRTTKSIAEYQKRVKMANGKGRQTYMEYFINNPDFHFEEDSTYYLLNTSDEKNKWSTKDIEATKNPFCTLNLKIKDAFEFSNLINNLGVDFRGELVKLLKKYNSKIVRPQTIPTLLDNISDILASEDLNFKDLELAQSIKIDFKILINGKSKSIVSKDIMDFFASEEIKSTMLAKYDKDKKSQFWKPNANSLISIIISTVSTNLNCTLIPEDKIDTIHKYNPIKYLEKLNKTHSNLLIIFDKKVRERLLSKKGEPIHPSEDMLKLVCGQPLLKKEDAMTSLEDLQKVDQSEIDLWYYYGLSPHYAFDKFVFDKDKKYEITKDYKILENPNGYDYKKAIDKLLEYQFTDFVCSNN